MQVLGALTYGTASAAVAVADFAMRERMLDQPRVRRLFLHGGLAFAAGASGLATAGYGVFASIRPPPPQAAPAALVAPPPPPPAPAA